MSITVSIREPLGTRQASLPLTIGAEGADLLVPGDTVFPLTLEVAADQWTLRGAPDMQVVVNGCTLRVPVSLAAGDVLRVGDAQIVLQPELAQIQVEHLVGNATVAPIQAQALPGEEVVAGVREIIAAGGDSLATNATMRLPSRLRSRPLRWLALGSAAVLAGVVAWVLFGLVPVAVQLTPAAATINSPGWLDWRAGDRIFLLPGRRTLQIAHPGYRSQTVTLNVTRQLADAAPLPIQLALLPGVLVVDTHGETADLLVDGRKVATLPGEALLEAGTRDIIVRAPRRVDFVARLEIKGAGARQSLDAPLQSATGWLVLDTVPAAALVSVDGAAHGAAPARLELDSGLRNLSLRAPGRRVWSSQVAIIAGQTLDLGRIDLAAPAPLPLPAVVQAVAPPVATVEVAKPEPRTPPPARVQSALLGTLVLLPAGSYAQGSERREQGRRANEVLRNVTLTRPYYLAQTEVSNVQFRAFRASHSAGIAMDKSLDLDYQPVTNVSWNDAVEFCNWLSLREGLPVAYERRDGRWQLVQPAVHGFRLPTEAEWEYAARYVNGQRPQRYAWGDVLPPPAGAANLAGQESLPTRPGPDVRLAAALPDYRDEHTVAAPIGSYARTPSGLHDMGGNVTEWMHDVYVSMPDAGAATDPAGPATDGAHAIRGASWRTANIAELRLAWRERGSAPSQTLGFRVARSVEVTP